MRKTYREWQERGYHVRKGERSCGRNDRGECVFDEEQVEPNRGHLRAQSERREARRGRGYGYVADYELGPDGRATGVDGYWEDACDFDRGIGGGW